MSASTSGPGSAVGSSMPRDPHPSSSTGPPPVTPSATSRAATARRTRWYGSSTYPSTCAPSW
ncbi:hypothetical protein AB0H28_24810 [Micromonospora sp. NPDC050980]|uniref:hypothetical protein n=1 Tax=Micromonospora sp. NPDC050980 TaxID=3155161 RepID=UPI00340EE296